MISDMDFSKVCSRVQDLVLLTASFIEDEKAKQRNLDIEVKGRQNYVTSVDKNSEKMLVKGLHEIIPDSGFITEEGTASERKERFNWIIDPIDGTTNFIHGLYPYAISVALIEYNEIVTGVIYELGLKECFYAWKDSPAWLNGKEIKVSGTAHVNDALIATGFPYTNFKYLERFMETLMYFMENSHGIRRLGSAATDIAYTACGRFDGFYEYGLSPWDVAAGILILKQAGGRVSDFNGGEDYLFGGEIVAANGAVFQEFQQLIKKFMKE